jgi:hypothetical protein
VVFLYEPKGGFLGVEKVQPHSLCVWREREKDEALAAEKVL